MKVKVFVGEKSVELNPFVERYLAAVFSAAAGALKGTGSPRILEFTIQGKSIAISTDSNPIEINGFAKVIVYDTLTATLKHLKGFSVKGDSKDIDSNLIRIIIER